MQWKYKAGIQKLPLSHRDIRLVEKEIFSEGTSPVGTQDTCHPYGTFLTRGDCFYQRVAPMGQVLKTKSIKWNK